VSRRHRPGRRGLCTRTAAGTDTITATTEWSGKFRVDGDTQWHDILGTAETTASSPPFDIVERRSRLVATDCVTDPTQPDC